jgi:membrane protease subunit HflK
MFKHGRPKIWNRPGGDNQTPGGRKRNEGPPDLDQIFRQILNKIKSLLGNKPQGKSSMDGQEFQSIGIVIVAGLLILYLISGIYIVEPPERAVIMRFGKYVKTVGPGPHWLFPLIESKEIVNVEQVATKDHSGLMLTRDGNIVSVGVAVQYRIGADNEDVRAYLFNVVNPIRSLNQSAESALRQVVGQSTMDEVLTQKRSEIANAIKVQIVETLNNYNTGIRVSDVVMQFAKAPDEVRAAFDDVIKASADEERLVNQARAYENEVLPKAKGTAEQLRNEALGYKQETILLAEGNVQRFNLVLPQYLKAPKVTQARLYIDTLEEILSKTSKIIVDAGVGNNLINLPLKDFLSEAERERSSAESPSNNSGSAAALQYQQKEKTP